MKKCLSSQFIFPVLVIGLAWISLSSCQNKNEQRAQARSVNLQDVQLPAITQYLPSNSFAFFVGDYEHPGMKAYVDSAWAQLENKLTNWQLQAASSQAQAVESQEAHIAAAVPLQGSQDLIQSFRSLMRPNNEKNGPKDLLTFVGPDGTASTTEKPSVNFCVSLRFRNANPAIADFLTQWKKIAQSSKDASIKIEELSPANGPQELHVQFPFQDFSVKAVALHTDRQLSVCSQKEKALALFNPPTEATAGFVPNEDFTQQYQAISRGQAAMGVFYIDFPRLIGQFSKTFETLQAGEAGLAGNLPKLTEGDFPLRSAIGGSFVENNQLRGTGEVTFLSGKKDAVSQIFQAFASSPHSSYALLKDLPKESPLALGMDLSWIKGVKTILSDPKFVTNEKDKETQAQVIPVLDQLLSLNSFRLGVGSATAGSFIPTIHMAVETEDSAQTSSNVKAMLGLGAGMAMGAGGAGMPESAGASVNWSSKTIAGVQTDYFFAPMGIGVFLAAPDKNHFYLSSSEAGIQSLLSANKNTGSDLSASLAQVNVQTNQKSSGELFTLHLNLQSAADVAEQVYASASLFTGGASIPKEAQEILQLMRQAGAYQFHVQAWPEHIRFDAFQDLAPVPSKS